MKIIKKRVLALLVMMTMLLCSFQTAYAADAQSEGGTTEQAVEYEYELLSQEPMRDSATASSQEPSTTYNEGAASYAFDGNLGNAWHTLYAYDNAPRPHWIQWNLGDTYQVGRLEYQRKAGANNGNWRTVTIEVQLENDAWQQVYDGEVAHAEDGPVIIDFTPVTAKAMKVTVKTATGEGGVNNYFASAGEINVYKAIANVPEEQAVVIARIDGIEYGGSSLADVIAQSGVAADDVESIEFVSGTITQADLAYMKDSTTYLTDLKMNLSDTLVLTDAEGNPSTVLPGTAFQNARLETIELGGFTEIGGMAFQGCTSLTSVSMPDMEVIGNNAFYWTDDYENIVIPASIKTFNNCGFGVAKNGSKEIHVVMEGTVPPTVDGRVFTSAGANSDVTVPAESLPTYLPNLDLTKHFGTGGETKYHGLHVIDPEFHFISYLGKNSWDKKYAYVHDGEAVTEGRIPTTFKNDPLVLTGWNTKKDGSGTALDATTIPTADMLVYAIFEAEQVIVTAKINGVEYGGSSLANVIAKSGVAADDVESIEFVSGTITQADLAYMKDSTTYLTDLKMNLSDTLVLTDAEGNPSTVLPGTAFQNARLETIELGGFTEIGGMVFQGCTSLTSVSMPDMEVIGNNAFYWTDDYENIVIPASIKTLNNCGFGVAKNGSKEIHVVMEGTVPPTVDGRVFTSAGANSDVTVPAGSLPTYLPNLDLTKHFGTGGETKYHGLHVIDPEYHFISYLGKNSWDKKYAYVHDGEAVTEGRIPTTFKNDPLVLTGWNTKKDGSGTALDAATIPTADMLVYAQWGTINKYTITFDTNGGTPIESVTLEENEVYTLPSSPLQGFSQEGWYLTGTDTKLGNSVTVTSDLNLVMRREILAPNVTIKINDSLSQWNGKQRILTAEVPVNEGLVYTYQWYKDGTPIEGATEKELTLNGWVSDSGEYKVVVTVAKEDSSSVVTTNETVTGEKTYKLNIGRLANTLRYNWNDGSEKPKTSDSYTNQNSITVRERPERTGYTFIGWNTKADGSGTMYKIGATYPFADPTDNNGNGGQLDTVYAQWKINQYTVTFEPNGGAPIDPVVADYGTRVKLPSSPLDGFTQSGWRLEGTDTVYNGKNVLVESNMTLVIQREIRKPDVKITMDKTIYHYIAEPRTLTAEVKEYAGLVYEYQWYKDGVVIQGANAKTLTIVGNVSDSGEYKLVVTVRKADGSTVITTNEEAVGEGIYKVSITKLSNTIRYNWNDGSEEPETSDHYTNATNITIRVRPTRTGYTFIGWNTKADGSGTMYQIGATYPFADPTDNNGNGGQLDTVYAQWKANQYKVSFDSNGGSKANPITVTYDQAIGELPNTTREGYEFRGWYDADGNKVSADTIYRVAGNSTLTARWRELTDDEKYTGWTFGLYFDSKGGTPFDPMTVTYGKAIGMLPTPVLDGYTFIGWMNDDGQIITADTVYKLHRDSTVVAQWTRGTTNGTANGTVSSPQTGDNSPIMLLGLAMLISALAAVAFGKKRFINR